MPRTHDIQAILDLLEGSGLSLPPEVADAAYLTTYAVEARYASFSTHPDQPDELRKILAMSAAVADWIIAKMP